MCCNSSLELFVEKFRRECQCKQCHGCPCYNFIVTSFMLIFKNCFVIGDLSLLIVVYFHDRFLQIQIKIGYTALCTQVISFFYIFEIPMCVIYGVQQGYDK